MIRTKNRNAMAQTIRFLHLAKILQKNWIFAVVANIIPVEVIYGTN